MAHADADDQSTDPTASANMEGKQYQYNIMIYYGYSLNAYSTGKFHLCTTFLIKVDKLFQIFNSTNLLYVIKNGFSKL